MAPLARLERSHVTQSAAYPRRARRRPRRRDARSGRVAHLPGRPGRRLHRRTKPGAGRFDFSRTASRRVTTRSQPAVRSPRSRWVRQSWRNAKQIASSTKASGAAVPLRIRRSRRSWWRRNSSASSHRRAQRSASSSAVAVADSPISACGRRSWRWRRCLHHDSRRGRGRVSVLGIRAMSALGATMLAWPPCG